MKTDVDKLDINKLVTIPTSLSNLKTQVDDLDNDKLKFFSEDFSTTPLVYFAL